MRASMAGAVACLGFADSAGADGSFGVGATGDAKPRQISLEWPTLYSQAGFQKARSACLFAPGTDDLLVLAGGDLVLVRDPLVAPRFVGLVSGVRDFAVLPGAGGLARVAIVGAQGLWLSTTRDGLETGPALAFDEQVPLSGWEEVELLDAAGASDGWTIVGAGPSGLLRAHKPKDSEVVERLEQIELPFAVVHLAAGDALAAGGVEFAVASCSQAAFFDATGAQYLGRSTAGNFVDLERIPGGADARDSFGLASRHAQGDLLEEIVGGAAMAPVHGGDLRIQDLSYGQAGPGWPATTLQRADLLLATTSGHMVVLHGTPQVAGATTFDWNAALWTVVPLPSGPLPAWPSQACVAAGDFDGDGDGDLAVAGALGGAGWVALVRNDMAQPERPTALVQFVGIAGTTPELLRATGGGEVGVDALLSIARPTTFGAQAPNKVRVRIYTREYDPAVVGPRPDVSSAIWHDQTCDVFPDPLNPDLFLAPVVVPPKALPDGTQGPLDPTTTLLYFELIPQLWQGGTMVMRASASIHVAAGDANLLAQVVCVDEPDEYSVGSSLCDPSSTGGAPIFTDTHRRRVLRRIPPLPPQPGPGQQ
ncbi:MAG: hypothetical protein RL112_1295 [Planctomycetota bacterium]